ncbi:hypothetical protein Fmac_019220 [Flemingia macrophylla]|uniref:Seed biotin-containing protein SBP65 n=1 Tax=Flemingia macrophylla TaxID=520843 RepID=A0ABD1M776_9FABA
MASQQLVRTDDTTITTDKLSVPNMATRFEEHATAAKEAPHAHASGRGKPRETHELGSHFESLSDKVKGDDHQERVGHHAANINVVGNKEGEGVTRVGKFELKTEGEERGNVDREAEDLQRQTREVKGRRERERGRESKGQVVAEKGGVGAENDEGASPVTCALEEGGDNNEKPREEKKNAASQQQGCAAVAKDSISSAVEKAAPVAEKVKDVTVESGKTAAEYAGRVAADLKDRAVVAGWAAAHFSTEKTVEGTKAAAHVVEGAAGYAGQKAAELAAKSASAVKDLAASAGETAKGYTARKKEEARREFQAKKASQPQEASKGIGETESQYGQKAMPGEQEGLLDNNTEGGGKVLGSVGETAGEIGQNVMKPAERVQEHGQEAQKEGGVLSAIGGTVAEIAETAKIMVVGEDDKKLKQNAESETRVTDRAKHHEGSQNARVK